MCLEAKHHFYSVPYRMYFPKRYSNTRRVYGEYTYISHIQYLNERLHPDLCMKSNSQIKKKIVKKAVRKGLADEFPSHTVGRNTGERDAKSV